MKVISYRKDGLEGNGIMVDEVNCVSLGSSMPDLPTTLMGLFNLEGGIEAAKSAIQGRTADLNLQDIELLPLIPDTPVIWCAGVNYKDHADETGHGHQDEPMLFIRSNHGVTAHEAHLLNQKFPICWTLRES